MLQQNTLDFLASLRENNHKEWFDANRKAYEAAKDDMTKLVAQLLNGITLFDARLAGVEAKKALFRIFRDVRFGHDKRPYKHNMGAWLTDGGKDSMNAGYYLHVEPGGNSFVAGGSYMPSAPILKSIREAIDYDHEGIQEILNAKNFVKAFGSLGGETVKTAPKGYAKDHPAIELLKHKSFVVSKNFTDAELTSPDFVKNALAAYKEMYPLAVFLNRAIAEAEKA
jgi:uncharacterized protein (TIGR02453 family)